ncbi:MAG: PcfB family protein, partial [Bacteroidales bacterium]|nr:PcfB family protein [Bacteroidales bacterium]
REEQKTHGKARLSNMIKSGSELKVFTVQQKDLKKFAKEAKRYGVLYSILREKGNEDPNAAIDIIARANDAPKITRIVERFNLSTVDKASVVRDMEAERNPALAKTGNEPQSLRSLNKVEDIPTDKERKLSVREEIAKYRAEMKKEQGRTTPRGDLPGRGNVRKPVKAPKKVKER